MSLRVLLADESASIKKVFQLGLQDYAAEVKTVQSGVDVLEVAEKFSPDIIFADILLQKQNGYDVCEALKQNDRLKGIPFVLMWSSFMELDQNRFQQCHADGEIEKPFEVDALRGHIQKLVEKTHSQHLSSFLEFPEALNQEFIEEERQKAANPPPQPAAPPPPAQAAAPEAVIIPPSPVEDEAEIENSSVFNTDNFEIDGAEAGAPEQDELQMEPAAPPTTEAAAPAPPEAAASGDFADWAVNPEAQAPPPEPVPLDDSADSWQSTPLTKTGVSVEPPAQVEENVDGFESYNIPEGNEKDLKLDDFLYKPGDDESVEAPAGIEDGGPEHIDVADVHIRNMDEEDGVVEETAPVAALTPEQVKHAVLEALPKEEIEAIVRAHTQELIKLNIEEKLPQIIERIAREELDQILKEELATKADLSGGQ